MSERSLPPVREVVVTAYLMSHNARGETTQSMSRRTLFFPTTAITLDLVVKAWNKKASDSLTTAGILLPPANEMSALVLPASSAEARTALRTCTWPDGVKGLGVKDSIPDELAIIFFDFVRDDPLPTAPVSVFNLS